MSHAPDVSVVLAPEPGPRVVGLPARVRNQRVIARAGAARVEPAAAAALEPERPLLALPSTATVQVALFAHLPPPESGACLLGSASGPGPHALFGRACEVAPLLPAFLHGDDLRESGSGQLTLIELHDDCLLSLATPVLTRRATTRLLQLAAKPTDGIVSRHLNRKLSRFCSRIFLALGLTPVHASLLNLIFGLGSAYFAAQTGYATMVMAGALFQLASAFDGVDGEMARVTLTESARGAWIDTAVDNVTYVACLAGVTVGWMREGVGRAGLALGVLLLASVPLLLIALARFVRRYAPDGSFVFVDRCVARAAHDSGRPSLRLARILFYALRRDVFALLFFIISLSGSRASVPLTVAFGELIALGTLLAHRPCLLAAARALCMGPPRAVAK